MGKSLVSASRDGTLRVWDIESGFTVQVLQEHEDSITGVVGMNKAFFSTGNDGYGFRWKISDNQRVKGIDLPGKPVSCAISPSADIVAVGFDDGAILFYGLVDAELKGEITHAHTTEINRLAFSSNGKRLASVGFDDVIKLWQLSDCSLEQIFHLHEKGGYSVAFSPNGRHLVAASFDGKIAFFEIGQNEGRFHLAHEGKDVNSVTFDANGQRIVSAGEDGKIRLWDITNWPPVLIQDILVSSENLFWATYSPDGQHIAGVGRDQSVYILSTNDGHKIRLDKHENSILRVAFSPDGKQVATVSTDATVRLWDLATEKTLFTLPLPATSSEPVPLWDFDFCCRDADCWITVPLTCGKLIVYKLEGVYD